MESEDEPIDHARMERELPSPTEAMLEDPRFEAIWQCIKTWDINVPAAYGGYCGATGSHVRAILDALAVSNGEQ
jgi:hypothetical protein